MMKTSHSVPYQMGSQSLCEGLHRTLPMDTQRTKRFPFWATKLQKHLFWVDKIQNVLLL